MPNIAKITGPPGTGKTSYAMRQIARDCEHYFPRQIGAISLTNAAVSEIKARISSELNVPADDAENVRTIHSHCFRLLGLDGKQIADNKIKDFNKENPDYAMSLGKGEDFDDMPDMFTARQQQYNDSLFREMQINRNKLLPIEKWADDTQNIYEAWAGWMQDNDFIDYTGMLEGCLQDGLKPDIDVLYVDEMQDLSRLANSLVMDWVQGCDKGVFIGDADQAIFRFSGAVPESFIEIKGDFNKVLEKSYRVPPKVHTYAQQIIRQCDNREDVQYSPDDRYGPGDVFECYEPDLSLPGSHMIISRCNYMVRGWIDWLYHHKTPFHNPYRPDDLFWNPQKTKSWRAIKDYVSLMMGKNIKTGALKNIASCCIAKNTMKHGAKGKVKKLALGQEHDIFDLAALGFTENFIDTNLPIDDMLKITGKAKDLIIDFYNDGDDRLVEQPNVIIGTIHSVKGGEADHVWLDTSLNYHIQKALIENRENVKNDEARVAYVAATRAKKTLGLLKSKNRNPLLPKI